VGGARIDLSDIVVVSPSSTRAMCSRRVVWFITASNASVVIANPGGTGAPADVMIARLVHLPPRRSCSGVSELSKGKV